MRSLSGDTDGSVKKVQRKVYSVLNRESKDVKEAKLIREEGKVPSEYDAAAEKCYEYFGDVYRFFSEVFQRDSVDGKGMTLVGLTHYGLHYPNARWDDSAKLMWLGDGYQKDLVDPTKPAPKWEGYFGNFHNSLEVIGHELMHGITLAVAPLFYYGESGALSEHLSDVFGLMIKHFKLNQNVFEADWLVGQDLIVPELKNMAFRSFISPGKAYQLPDNAGHDAQVKHYSECKETTDDLGGVHMYSGVLNHAFYLAAKTIGGYSWETLGRLWWQTLTEGDIKKFCTFSEWAGKTMQFAKRYDDKVYKAVDEAWVAVGIPLKLAP